MRWAEYANALAQTTKAGINALEQSMAALGQRLTLRLGGVMTVIGFAVLTAPITLL